MLRVERSSHAAEMLVTDFQNVTIGYLTIQQNTSLGFPKCVMWFSGLDDTMDCCLPVCRDGWSWYLLITIHTHTHACSDRRTYRWRSRWWENNRNRLPCTAVNRHPMPAPPHPTLTSGPTRDTVHDACAMTPWPSVRRHDARRCGELYFRFRFDKCTTVTSLPPS